MTKKSCRRGGDRVDILVCGRVGLGGINLGFTAEQLLILAPRKGVSPNWGKRERAMGPVAKLFGKRRGKFTPSIGGGICLKVSSWKEVERVYVVSLCSELASRTFKTGNLYFSNFRWVCPHWLIPPGYRKILLHHRLLLKDFSGTVAAGEMLRVIEKPGKWLHHLSQEHKKAFGKVSYGSWFAKHMAKKGVAETAFYGTCGLRDSALSKELGFSHVSQLALMIILQFWPCREVWGKYLEIAHSSNG